MFSWRLVFLVFSVCGGVMVSVVSGEYVVIE